MKLRALTVFLSLGVSSHAFAQAASALQVMGVGPVPSSATYVGPGDIVSGASAWYGLRAYSATYAASGGKAINVRRASDNTTQDINVLTSGALDVSSANTFAGTDATGTGAITGTTLTFTGGHVGDTVTGGTTAAGTYIVSGSSPTWTVNISQTVVSTTLTLTWGLYVTEMYDQTGNTRPITQSTAANQPQLLTAGGPSSSKPYVSFTNGTYLRNTSFPVSSIPRSSSAVADRTGNLSTQSSIYINPANTAGFAQLSFSTSANTIFMYDGTVLSASEADSSWHAFQVVFNSTSSVITVDGTDTSGDAGNQTVGSTSELDVGRYVAGASQQWIGSLGELGINWTSGFSTGNRASLNSNQHAYWGF